ncbi:LysR family transcriptional regulator [Streptomyces afghaniensis]|uniref:LysR family transcriptional regulator n=1 Tax=Streptomyces afghaniensis TaxID=66865 RepID=UPI002787758F|nr:LysR family transcriptional regulator [Streptomyces afghaniensis]MDQ1018729.1 DNA-binding transcriptional LysR family regulator [Streptomyces afghaniensis]
MYNLRRLQMLRELKHRGTLAAVATALSYSPSAVSQQLSLLENEVGAPLLQPHGRRVRLTPQADILVAHTEAVLRQLDQAAADIAASLAEVTGTLRVAGFQTAALALLPRALTWLGETHPGVRVTFTQAEPDTALAALLARDCDVVIDEVFPGRPQARATEVEHQLLARDLMRLATPGPAELAELAGRPWAMEPAGTPAREWTTAVCQEAGFEPDVAFETADMLVHAELVAAGHAAAFLPDLLWHDRRPPVALYHLAARHHRDILVTVRSGAAGHPLIRALLAALSAAADAARTAAHRHLTGRRAPARTPQD